MKELPQMGFVLFAYLGRLALSKCDRIMDDSPISNQLFEYTGRAHFFCKSDGNQSRIVIVKPLLATSVQ